MIPDGLWQHPDRQPIDGMVWCALVFIARDRDDVTTTNRALAEAAMTSVRTLRRSLTRLVNMGFVKPEGTTSNRVLRLCPDAVEPVYTLRIAN